jgi:hypothetical protein
MIAIAEHFPRPRYGAVGASSGADLLRRERLASPPGISRDHRGARIHPGRTACEMLHVVDQSFRGRSTMRIKKSGICQLTWGGGFEPGAADRPRPRDGRRTGRGVHGPAWRRRASGGGRRRRFPGRSMPSADRVVRGLIVPAPGAAEDARRCPLPYPCTASSSRRRRIRAASASVVGRRPSGSSPRSAAIRPSRNRSRSRTTSTWPRCN